MSEINYLTATPAQLAKERFNRAKSIIREVYCIKLPDFRAFVFKKEKQYNCPEGWTKIQKAWNGYTSDLRLTELIEEFQRELMKLKEL